MESNVKAILSRYRPVGRVYASELLLAPADALRLIDDLEQVGVRIVGLDYWYPVKAGMVQAWWLEPTVDAESVAGSAEQARHAVAHLPAPARDDEQDRVTWVSLIFDKYGDALK